MLTNSFNTYFRSSSAFFRDELRSRLSDGLLGWYAILLLPLLQLAVLYFVFTEVFPTRQANPATGNYLNFLALGFWPWLAFSETVLRLSSILVEKAGLLKKVTVPHVSIVLGVGSATFFLHFSGFVAVVGVLILSGNLSVKFSVLASIQAWLMLFVLAGSLGLSAALISVFIRDLPRMIGLAMTLLFFLTPVFYPLDNIPVNLRSLLDWNPLVAAILSQRAAFQITSDAGFVTMIPALVSLSGITLMTYWLYQRLDKYVEDFM